MFIIIFSTKKLCYFPLIAGYDKIRLLMRGGGCRKYFQVRYLICARVAFAFFDILLFLSILLDLISSCLSNLEFLL